MSGESGASEAGTAISPELAARFRLVVTRLSRRLRQEAASGGVSPSQLSTLASLERHGPATLGELAALEQVQPPTMTRIVAHLEEAHLVTRTPDAHDRRVARVALTPEGTDFIERHRTRKDASMARRLRRLSPAEVATVADALPLLERLTEGEE